METNTTTNLIAEFLGARNHARKLASQQTDDQLLFARRFVAGILSSYRQSFLPPVEPMKHPLAEEMGLLAQKFNADLAAYLIGTTYTVMLPAEFRGDFGVFYTPPALVERLLDLAEQAGVDWSTAKILDPACGGGAFLSPIARRMNAALSHLSSVERLQHIEKHLMGIEIDPFGAWISKTFVEISLSELICEAKHPLANLVIEGDSLQFNETLCEKFDLVAGNPPYGRIKLSEKDRIKWSRGLYGHANLYGLFTDLAARLASPNGVVAYVTPTSFLGGQYFRELRRVLSCELPPVAIDFISSREGVFADALQETLLAVYKKQDMTKSRVEVSYLSVTEAGSLGVTPNGSYKLPSEPGTPWILPRSSNQAKLAETCRKFTFRLSDLGYTVSTGPLVWNRHKEKLFSQRVTGAVPLIWAECVDPTGSGVFTFKATGRNHVPWYRPERKNDPNLVKSACVLLQRTTSLEQSRRLIAAEIPQSFIDSHGGAVAVENHLNMVRPILGQTPLVSSRVIAALFNSDTVDQIFRCISGSAAVSAYELEAMPLPAPQDCKRLEKLLACSAQASEIEIAIKEMYCNVRISAAA